MPRDLIKFTGTSLLVGGGWCSNHSLFKPSWRRPEDFYTIDRDERAEPDQVIDITNPLVISLFPKRFNFIYFENVGFSQTQASRWQG